MGLALFVLTLLPGGVLAFAAFRREGSKAGWLIPFAGGGYFAGALLAAFMEAGDPRARPVFEELIAPWRTPFELLPAAGGLTVAVAVGTVLLRRAKNR